MEQEKNSYIEEMKKFEGKEVIVIDRNENKVKGLCKAINYNYGHVILMTNKEKILMRNVAGIVRDRSYKGK